MLEIVTSSSNSSEGRACGHFFLNLFCHFEPLDMTRLVCVCFEMSIIRTSATFHFALTTLPMQRSIIAEADVHMFQASFDECPSISRVQFWPLQLVGCGFRCDTTMGSHRRQGSKMSSKRRNPELFWLLWALLWYVCVNNDAPLSSPRSPREAAETTPFVFSDASHASIPVHTRKTSTPIR